MKKLLIVLFLVIFSAGCQGYQSVNTAVSAKGYAGEAQWIRNGEPIEFEGETWYPKDGIETLLDSEVFLIAKYRQVEIFIDKIDVRPYNRLYTKFDRNKYRYFEKKQGK